MNKLDEINASKVAEIKRLEPHADELRKQALLRNDFRPSARRCNCRMAWRLLRK
jgi:hypothetical protein